MSLFTNKTLMITGATGSFGNAVLNRFLKYVSHNMNTIRQLCDRVIVLDHGKIVFDGDVEDGISVYMNDSNKTIEPKVDLSIIPRAADLKGEVLMKSIEYLNCNGLVLQGEKIKIKLTFFSKNKHENVRFRMIIKSLKDNTNIGMTLSKPITNTDDNTEYSTTLEFDTTMLVPGSYSFTFALFNSDDLGNVNTLDYIDQACYIQITKNDAIDSVASFWNKNWGHIYYPELKIL